MANEMTIAEVCNKYRISRETLMRWRKMGIVSTIKSSRRRVLFNEDQLERELGLTVKEKMNEQHLSI